MFWTSGTDLGCDGNFGYCTTNRLLRDEAKCVCIKKYYCVHLVLEFKHLLDNAPYLDLFDI
jgi:hypothetical protein